MHTPTSWTFRCMRSKIQLMMFVHPDELAKPGLGLIIQVWHEGGMIDQFELFLAADDRAPGLSDNEWEEFADLVRSEVVESDEPSYDGARLAELREKADLPNVMIEEAHAELANDQHPEEVTFSVESVKHGKLGYARRNNRRAFALGLVGDVPLFMVTAGIQESMMGNRDFSLRGMLNESMMIILGQM